MLPRSGDGSLFDANEPPRRIGPSSHTQRLHRALDPLVDGVDDASSPKEGAKIYFLRRLPPDPFWPDATTPAADTWGLRSYASPPDDPQAGEDVFDVHSRSSRTGLNGVPYRDW